MFGPEAKAGSFTQTSIQIEDAHVCKATSIAVEIYFFDCASSR
jgi:hypothetical protein